MRTDYVVTRSPLAPSGKEENNIFWSVGNPSISQVETLIISYHYLQKNGIIKSPATP